MGPHQPTGWNTWDFRGFNRLVFLRRGKPEIIVQYAIWDESVPPPAPDSKQIGKLYDTFRWSDARKLGEHAALGLPATLEFTAGTTPYKAQAVEVDGEMRISLTPLAQTGQRVVFVFLAPLGETPVETGPNGGKLGKWLISLDGASWPADYFLNIAEPYAVGAAGVPASISLRAKGLASMLPSPAPAVAQEMSGSGCLADAPDAMIQAITWNTLYDMRRGLISSPVSRDWCYDWRGVLVFCWDTFLVGTVINAESPELARLNFEAVTAAIDEIAMVPNYYMAHGAVSLDRSMPPLGAYLIWKTQLGSPDKAWLSRIYRRMRIWHRYWMPHRDGNKDGLLEWGSDPAPHYDFPQLVPYNPALQHEAICAKYESGLDNSPLFDETAFNKTTNTFELADVALNSYYAMDCEALAAMADYLGRPGEAKGYRAEYEQMKKRVNDQLWDEEHGLYANRHWDGRFSKRWAPTSFFPLIAGLATPERAQRMVREHLLNDGEFWGQYVIPAIARSDPAFGDNDYWRGRIWGPFNFLVAEGLRRYRLDDTAAELARKGLEMFMHNWRTDGGVYENYNAVTGQGGDVWNAARLYHWGGLMAFIAVQEFVDIEATGYLRLGSIGLADGAVAGVHAGGSRYDVDLTGGLKVLRDGHPFAECTTRAVVRIPLGEPEGRPVEITPRGPGRLTLLGMAARPVMVGGTAVQPHAENGNLLIEW